MAPPHQVLAQLVERPPRNVMPVSLVGRSASLE
jgi:hypothetical protein